ncbi:hypothetical protein CEXT_765721 [Caerostris extrusa]|uniref:Uncharacterized protein n=1 Tax=Caerostris extrusa TaxID=172846 RepID=A0AAV4VJF9_CAEEX|nr:hypothetical protein CEXT_765721 [Caerostris extrusa]
MKKKKDKKGENLNVNKQIFLMKKKKYFFEGGPSRSTDWKNNSTLGDAHEPEPSGSSELSVGPRPGSKVVIIV